MQKGKKGGDMFTTFMHSSREYQTFLCERAAISANRKSSTGSRNLKNLAKKNRDILGSYIEDAIKTLSAVYLMDKPAAVVLEVACIKGLFMWFLDNADELENDEASSEFQLAKRVISILNQDYKKVGDKLSAEMMRIEDENDDYDDADSSAPSRNTRHAKWYNIIDEMCLTIMWTWGKCRFVANISNSDINSFAYRFMLYLIDRLYFFTWAFTKEQIEEYSKYTRRRIQLGLKSPGDESFQLALEIRMREISSDWDFNSLVRTFDVRDGIEADVSFYGGFRNCHDSDNWDSEEESQEEDEDADEDVDAEDTEMRISLRMCLEGLFAEQGGVFVGDILKVGLSPKELTAVSNSLQNGVFQFQEYLNNAQNTFTNDDFLNLPKNQIIAQYVQQTSWEMKIIYRVIMLAIFNMRQLVLQQYYLKEQGKGAPAKKSQKKSDKEKAVVAELQARIRQLEQENKQLYDKNSSLMRKNNRLLYELESEKSEKTDCSNEEEPREDMGVRAEDSTAEADLGCECETTNDEVDWVEEINKFTETHSVVVVGGDENLLKNISKEMPKISLIYGGRSTSSDNLVSHADIVFFRYSALPHSTFNRVRKTCTSYGVPYEYLPDSTAIYLLAKDMFQKIKKQFSE